MSRPMKMRRICCLPEYNRFGPLGINNNLDNIVNMTLDEYETIRLIDLEGFTQAQCAKQMNVARTTVQSIYDTARKKIADSIVNVKGLFIDGGNYDLCNQAFDNSGRRACNRYRCGRPN